MYKDSIKLIEMSEHDSISLCVYCENDGLLALGDRINEQYEEAYMNGYNWDALISYYVTKKDPDLMSEIGTDPEAGAADRSLQACHPSGSDCRFAGEAWRQ